MRGLLLLAGATAKTLPDPARLCREVHGIGRRRMVISSAASSKVVTSPIMHRRGAARRLAIVREVWRELPRYGQRHLLYLIHSERDAGWGDLPA